MGSDVGGWAPSLARHSLIYVGLIVPPKFRPNEYERTTLNISLFFIKLRLPTNITATFPSHALPSSVPPSAKMLAPPAKIPPRACHMPAKTRLPRPCADCQNTACLNTACQRANMLIPFPAHACREETRLPLACRRLPKRASCQGTLSPDLSDRYQLECHQTCPVACSRVMGQCCLIPRSALQVAGAAGNKRRNAVPGRD